MDIEGLTALAASAPALEYDPPALPRFPKIHIAVAKDAAFCFYYSENFGLFEKMGAELSFFSPLEDAAPPAEADCLYFGGGYPELYAEKLSANASMLESVRAAHARGVPIFAECGGFLYLNRLLDGYAMAGVLHGESVNKHKPVRFGYVELEANEDCLIAKKGARLRGHEFHYYDCTENGEAFTARRKGSEYRCTAAEKRSPPGFAPRSFLQQSGVRGDVLRKLSGGKEMQEMKPMDIERKSFEIITSELTVPLAAGTEDIVKRVIHATADFDYAENLCLFRERRKARAGRDFGRVRYRHRYRNGKIGHQ